LLAAPSPSTPLQDETPAPFSPEGYRVQWLESAIPTEMSMGEMNSVHLVIANAGNVSWPYQISDESPINKVFVSYHWFTSDGSALVDWEGLRTGLPNEIAPGESFAVDLGVQAPNEPGWYVLQLTLVHEGAGWFETMGADTVAAPVMVD